jgi:hypothetical protein
MPDVKGKKFPYTTKGRLAAAEHAKKEKKKKKKGNPHKRKRSA